MHVVVSLGDALHVWSKSCLYEFTELNFLSVGSQLPPRTLDILINWLQVWKRQWIGTPIPMQVCSSSTLLGQWASFGCERHRVWQSAVKKSCHHEASWRPQKVYTIYGYWKEDIAGTRNTKTSCMKKCNNTKLLWTYSWSMIIMYTWDHCHLDTQAAFTRLILQQY